MIFIAHVDGLLAEICKFSDAKELEIAWIVSAAITGNNMSDVKKIHRLVKGSDYIQLWLGFLRFHKKCAAHQQWLLYLPLDMADVQWTSIIWYQLSYHRSSFQS